MAEFVINASKKKRMGPEAEAQLQREARSPSRVERTTHLPARRIEELKQIYSEVIVRDFGDSYHKSEEQLERENEFAKYQKKLASLKTRYTNLEQFIHAMRTCVEFLTVLAYSKTNQLLMDPETFIKKVLRGKIKVAGLNFPKYKGRDRKDLNWKIVEEYILDTEKDPAELVAKGETQDDVSREDMENPEEALHKYFSDEQIKFIFQDSKELKTSVSVEYDESIDGRRVGVARPVSKKELNNLTKLIPDVQQGIRSFRQLANVNRALSTFAYELERDAYEYISDLDEKRGISSGREMPKFEGSLMNEDDYKRYLYQLEEYAERNQRVEYNGRMITLADFREESLKDNLAACGWDVTKLYDVTEKIKKQEKARKRDEAKEKRLRKELTRIKKRKERRESGELINTKKKKGVKKKHKKKSDKFDDVAVSASNTGASDFNDYESRMRDMCWDFR